MTCVMGQPAKSGCKKVARESRGEDNPLLSLAYDGKSLDVKASAPPCWYSTPLGKGNMGGALAELGNGLPGRGHTWAEPNCQD